MNNRPIPVRKKAVLIYPPTGRYLREDRCQTPLKGHSTSSLRMPLDLAYLASALEQVGVACVIKDYPNLRQGWERFVSDLKEIRPDMLIISVTSLTIEKDMRAAELAKESLPSILTVAKGAHFLAADRDVLERHPSLDVVIRGEGEITIQELATKASLKDVAGITYRDGKSVVIRNQDRPFIEDIDRIPFPARHLLDNNLYVRPDTEELQTDIKTSRGCPYSCIFCLAGLVSGKKIRNRSPENVLAEIGECYKRYGIRNFHFRSDLFTMDKEWVIKLCKMIVDSGMDIQWVSNSRVDTIDEERVTWMRRAGCWLVSLGIESGSREMLEHIKKRITLDDARRAVKLCRKAGIKTYLYYIIGFPWETKETALDTIRFSHELDGDFIEVYAPYPFPGTELSEIVEKMNLHVPNRSSEESYKTNVFRSTELDVNELAKLRKKALRSFYLRPSYIIRTMSAVKSPKVMWNYVRKGLGFIVNR